MNNGQIYDFLVLMIRKNKEGSFLNAERYNTLLNQKMWSKINFEITRYEKSQIITEALRLLKHEGESISVDANGDFILSGLPSAYVYLFHSGLRYSDSGTVRRIPIVTDEQWTSKLSSIIEMPTARYPIARFTDSKIQFYPLVSETVVFDYLFVPTEPYYDYYIDANDKNVYLPEGSSYTLQTDETYTDKDDGTVRTSGYTISASENKSVELPFPVGERQSVVMDMLSSLGVPISDQILTQYGMMKEQKEDVI
jgi:hypothetical protein